MFALFWNMARRLIHSDISKDIEEFLKIGIKRIDNRGKQSKNNTYTIQYEGEVYEFQQGQLAPPVGFFTSNYSRAIYKEGAPHKYSLFWTTDRSLGEGEGGQLLYF
ncbi:hypothetical protein L873DRAFT_1875156 [Choiromyces venosus 120613-1]|uniref:Uncharacterized protein n=1 Tax=Choiromyces venosus 120613-1 TaxID=1336337 RepID=A0A3N4IX31_9PEZI|nr:hypothetical protein L873DRAFT_1875156 [Choiromyces venosus 120613-1]